MEVQLTDDDMADIKKDVLEKLRPYLCPRIQAERHFDYLRSRRIMNRDDAEQINSRPTHAMRASDLLDILSNDPCGLDALIESIQLSRCQSFIITKITDEVQKAKNEKIEALRASSGHVNNLGVSQGTSKDYSRTYSEDSTMLYHPDGEGSSCSSNVLGSSLDLRSLRKGGSGPSEAGWCNSSSSSSSSSSNNTLVSYPSTTNSSALLRPGDPGAPALPEEEELGSALSPARGLPPECSSSSNSGGDPNFQPLRSRSLSPMYVPSKIQ